MSNHPAADVEGPPQFDLRWTLAQIAAIWVVSDVGFYVLLPAFGVPASYNAGSVAVTLYYGFWVGIAVITFWPLYATWPLYVKWTTFESRLTSYAIWSLGFAAFVLFAAYVIPALPTIDWREKWNPPEIVGVTQSYFLPKSVDILFQQLLIVALVLAFADRKYNIRRISLYCAILFGSMHILLAFGGVPFGYVVRFAISAAAFGLFFPYLILRAHNGLAYSYIVHWIYYAISVVIPHIFLAK
ncbi:MAG: hypothetical protein WD036_06505 [Bauldia sp.]